LGALVQELSPLFHRFSHLSWLKIVNTGVGPKNAAVAAQKLGPRPKLILNVGCCGGLSPELREGDAVLADNFYDLIEGEYRSVAKPNRDLFLCVESIIKQLDLRYHVGPVLTRDQPIVSPLSKYETYLETHAIAVDMESAAIAQIAEKFRIPFVSLRYVLDPSTEHLDVINPKFIPSTFSPSVDRMVSLLPTDSDPVKTIPQRIIELAENSLALMDEILKVTYQSFIEEKLPKI